MTAHIEPRTPLELGLLEEKLWRVLLETAVAAGLDPAKFTGTHQEIVAQVVAFLEQTYQSTGNHHRSGKRPPHPKPSGVTVFKGLSRRKKVKPPPVSQAVPPIIICGVPGTGKTTFLSLLDIALRRTLDLPDAITTQMSKGNGPSHLVQKRLFNGRPVSLLSVRKWTQLLYFYAWDTKSHRLELEKGDAFIRERLRPMRVVFADEVEMTGYSPTLPNIARQGILVLGSSNQYAFSQLADELMPPRIYRFTGDDMRLGDPADALVDDEDAAWKLFERARQRPLYHYGRLPYQLLPSGKTLYALLNFHEAVNAPLLEAEWLHFCQTAHRQTSLESQPPLTLLFEQFSLDTLQRNYNAIIRFITLFDAIEQLGVGVLILNEGEGLSLSRAGLTQMKTVIESANDVPAAIKAHTLVGIERATSRIGQAAVRAKHFMEG